MQLVLKPTRVNGLLPSDVVMDIFSNIEGILSVNTELFLCMRQHSLAEAFSYLGPFLKLYSTYASNYQNALETLQVYIICDYYKTQCLVIALLVTPFTDIAETEPGIFNVCIHPGEQTRMQQPQPSSSPPYSSAENPQVLTTMWVCGCVSLTSSCTCRYKLLLEELLKHTRCTHLDYSKLNGVSVHFTHKQSNCCPILPSFSSSSFSTTVAAIQQIAAVASHINEFIRQQDNFKKMLAIQNCLAGSYIPGIVAPGRRFIKEGKLMKVGRHAGLE